MYGRQKLAGEEAIRVAGARACALRVPVLYGRTEYNGESAVNVLVDGEWRLAALTPVVKDQSGKTYTMDDYQIRNPTCVEDVGRVLFDLARAPALPAVTQFRSPGKPYTKWDMTQVIARALRLPVDHITPVSTKPTNGTERPWNTELSVKSLEAAGVSAAEARTFDEWWATYLQ
jgi:S-adenosylmethionine synthetase